MTTTTKRMRPSVKKKWLAALRSGEYKQGSGALRTADDRFCCLGVLCDLYAKEKEIPWEPNPDSTANYMFEGKTELPSDQVKAWAGLYDENPSVTIAGSEESLAELNDGSYPRGTDEDGDPVTSAANFEEIALLIEEQL